MRIVGILALAIAFGLSACGGDGGPPGAPATVNITRPVIVAPSPAPQAPAPSAPPMSDHTKVEHDHEGQGRQT